ncbi:MAG: hypothetical protein K0S32_2046 [Bacteroidetes bacterium]|nr:hypothetical protein [Bacteroidota bacterium]
MKKLIIAGLLFFAGKGFSQVSKADFEAIFSNFKFESMTSIYLKNTRTYYMNSTSALEQVEYTAGYFIIQLKDNAIYLISHEDITKAKVKNYMIIPYKSILKISASAKAFTIEMIE